MYDYISGTLASVDLRSAVVDVGGVGYRLNISEQTSRAIVSRTSVKLYAYLAVREDAMELYGFASEEDRACFLELLNVSGVGPKAALAVQSALTTAELAAAVAAQDHKAISRANGVGAKTAQRICLELKGKLGEVGDAPTPSGAAQLGLQSEKEDAVDVLASLGYSRADAKRAVERCSADNAQDLVRQALRILNTLR